MDKRRKTVASPAEDPRAAPAPDTAGAYGDQMKFRNADISLDDAIEHNGGHIVLSNVSLLFESNI